MAAEWVIQAMEAWLWIGAAVAVLFLLIGVDRIEPNARGAYLFRPLLVPGVLLLWPLVLWRWALAESGRLKWAEAHRPPRAAHGWVWALLAVALPLGAAALLWIAGATPVLDPPEKLSGARAPLAESRA